MAELAKLEIQIGADVKDATKGIDNLGRSIAKLEPLQNKLAKNSANASASLFSLSQVARDLPFGFIAIQNNLPQVIDSFGALSKQSGGTFKALKALGGALLGPAGIGFAFSVLTSSVTTLVQKYGSLGSALDALFLRTNAAADAQKKLVNAQIEALSSTAGEVVKINSLVAVLANLNNSQEERVNAYKILKKEYPGVIQNMTQENALTQAGTNLISERAAKLIEYIKLKGKESALTKLIEQASEKQLKSIQELKNVKAVDGAFKTLGATIQGFISGKSVAEVLVKPITDATEELDIYSAELAKLQQQFTQFDPKLTGVESFKEKTKSVTDELRKQLESRKKLLEEEVDRTSILSDKWLELKKAIASLDAQINVIGVTDPETIKNVRTQYQREIDALPALQMQAKIEAGRIDFQSVFQIDEKEASERFAKLIESIQKTGYEEAAKKAGTVKGKVEIIPSASIQEAIDTLAKLKTRLTDIANFVGGALSNAFATLWDKIAEDGKISLRDVGKAVKQLILDLIRAAIQAAVLNLVLKAFGVGGNAGGQLSGVLGGLLKSGAIKGFATGGVVTKPTIAMIGEGGEKEAIIPLSKLEGMLGGGYGGNVIVTGRIEGSDILLSGARETKRQRRG